MRHVYRQIVGMESVRPLVLTRKREEAARFPFDDVVVMPKPRIHELQRFWSRKVRDEPLQILPSEAARITEVLRSHHARLLHVYFGHIGVLLLPLIKAHPVPVVVSFHGADAMVDMDKPSFRLPTQTMLDAVDLVLARSESLVERLVMLGCQKSKIRIHRTGIPLDELPFQPRSFPKKGKWRVVQACRLIEKKGLPVTLRAFASFSREFPDSTLVIAGEGPLLSDLKDLAKDLGIKDRVTFPGFLAADELRRLYYEAHLFLHPSELGKDGNQEGVPNSMLEAMATGLPVVATTHGGIPEAIDNGVSGLLVDERDDKALAVSMRKLATDEVLYRAIGEAGSKAVSDKFEIRKQIRSLEGFYRELLGGH
jgi:colanic acid/amylovoran biosynthesis glycosyltransferase